VKSAVSSETIATQTPGLDITEHLPGLAQRSSLWSVVRSLTHPTNGHTLGHYYMLTGRSGATPGFRGDRQPRSTDFPSIASIVGDALPSRSNLPPAIVFAGAIGPTGPAGQFPARLAA
jgi:hypothetical protein